MFFLFFQSKERIPSRRVSARTLLSSKFQHGQPKASIKNRKIHIQSWSSKIRQRKSMKV
jgi:hypothetical protein